ncbi:MAG: glycosyltransferase family 39 protein [Planctomycetes bacterium]|nr:glycosyltransferase family 39 protein [Planctomycetota bacterium]
MRPSPPLLLVALAGLVRALVAVRTAMPERDAGHYLWMADGLLRGEPERLVHSVFHPLFPLLIGALRAAWPALDPIAAGQLVACSLGALAAWPLWTLTRALFGPRAAWLACIGFAVGTWFARHPADVLSEGPFHLLVAGAVCLLAMRARTSAAAACGAGLLAALAYLTRPEGASLGLCGLGWLLAQGARRPARAFAAGCAPALLLPLACWRFGDGFTLSPKAAFVWADGLGQGGGLAHYLTHLSREPGALAEAVGYVAMPAALVAAWLALRGRRRREAWLLLAPLLIQLAIVPILRTNHRFLSGYGLLLLPFAGDAWRRAAPWLAQRGRALPALVLALAFAPDAIRLPAARRTDRVIERDLGVWLGAHLRPGERLASTLQRLDYFAGVEPASPRTIADAELAAAATDPRVRFVVHLAHRPTPLDAELAHLGLTPVPLPADLAARSAERGIRVFGR